MNKENIPVITDREKLYDKCENMEQLFDKYYLPLLDKHYSKIYELQQEIKLLKIQASAREKVANKYKEVIDKLEKYIEKETRIYGLSMSIELETHFDNILGILREVE